MSNLDFEKIRELQEELDNIRNSIGELSNYYNIPYCDMYALYKISKPKAAEKYIEGWIAAQCGGSKISKSKVPEEYKKNDLGDLYIGGTIKVGENNLELKVSFDCANPTIGGGQFRFNEPVQGYLLFKAWDQNNYEMFLLSKEQLVSEIKYRATLRGGKSGIISSQGSGDICKLTDLEKINRLDENVNKLRADKLGWSFNSSTEIDYYMQFKAKYQQTFESIQEKY